MAGKKYPMKLIKQENTLEASCSVMTWTGEGRMWLLPKEPQWRRYQQEARPGLRTGHGARHGQILQETHFEPILELSQQAMLRDRMISGFPSHTPHLLTNTQLAGLILDSAAVTIFLSLKKESSYFIFWMQWQPLLIFPAKEANENNNVAFL